MMNDEWDSLNGEAIRIDANGVLVDGQHRLHAIIESGKPCLMCVMEGVSPKARLSVDSGQPRTTGQMLSIWDDEDHHNVNDLAATARWVFRYTHITPTGVLPTDTRGFGATKSEVLKVIRAYPGLMHSLERVGWSNDVRRLMSGSTAAFVHFMAAQTDPATADEFIEQLKTGANLAEASPVFVLRRQLARQMNMKNVRFHRDRTAAIMVKAWLAYESGKSVSLLKWLPGEPFPKFRCQWPPLGAEEDAEEAAQQAG